MFNRRAIQVNGIVILAPPDDPVFRLHELAEPIGPLTNAEMDAAIYGQ